MTTVAVGSNYVARVSRIEAFKSTTVGVSGTAYLRERLPSSGCDCDGTWHASHGPRRAAKQLPKSRRLVT